MPANAFRERRRRGAMAMLASAVLVLWPAAAPAPPPAAAAGESGGNAAAKEAGRTALIKAAFLYNFAKFVEWPSGVLPDTAAIQVGAVGADSLGAALDGLAGKEVRQHTLRVKRLRREEPLTGCHVLYLGGASEAERHAILKSLAGRPVLTVADCPDFVESGGIIQLLQQDNRLRFRVNLVAAHAAGLKLSSQLLQLAESVIADGGAKGGAP